MAVMARRMVLVVMAAVAVSVVAGAEPPPAVVVRAVRPDEQGERVLALFRGTRAAHPAAALAAWKHARGGRDGLGKPLEGLVAAFNPEMVRELKALDSSELTLGFEPGTGRPRWRLLVPNDDGSLAAFTAAWALTEGAADEPLGGVPVLRLGPPGAPVAATDGGSLVLASGREWLAGGEVVNEKGPAAGIISGWEFRLDPEGFAGVGSIAGRRLLAALEAVGCESAEGQAFLASDALTVRLNTRLGTAPRAAPRLDGSWLDVVPATGVFAAASVALDPSAESLDAAFAALDRIDRADPARAGVAPLRARLNLLAAAARVRPEVELWPNVRGVTGAAFADDAGRFAGALVALHAQDAAAAAALADRAVPRLAAAYARGAGAGADAPRPDGTRLLGFLDGKPLSLARRGSTVLVGWGDTALTAALDTLDHPERSAGPALRAAWAERPPQRAGAFWPGRLRRLAPAGSALAQVLDRSSPAVWTGRTEGGSALDLVTWPGLRELVRKWLDALPLDPPPGQE
jgi:hypothetical protein